MRTLLILIQLATMSAASSSAERPAKRQAIDESTLRSLMTLRGATKTSLVTTLETLKRGGYLSEHLHRKQLRAASEHHSSANTPYGKVVQPLKLGAAGLDVLDVCHPSARLYHRCSISSAFADMMHRCATAAAGVPMRLVIYVDELCPGNPNRPEKSRTMQCVYWAFADWPGWALSRTSAWPCLCLIRYTVIAGTPGKMTYICRMLIRLFPPLEGHSLDRGLVLPHGDESFLITGVSAGFLTDLAPVCVRSPSSR